MTQQSNAGRSYLGGSSLSSLLWEPRMNLAEKLIASWCAAVVLLAILGIRGIKAKLVDVLLAVVILGGLLLPFGWRGDDGLLIRIGQPHHNWPDLLQRRLPESASR
jgi:hypothetical protein